MLKIKDFIIENKKNFDLIDLEIFLCTVLNKEKSFLISNNDFQMNKRQLILLNNFLDKRKK